MLRKTDGMKRWSASDFLSLRKYPLVCHYVLARVIIQKTFQFLTQRISRYTLLCFNPLKSYRCLLVPHQDYLLKGEISFNLYTSWQGKTFWNAQTSHPKLRLCVIRIHLVIIIIIISRIISKGKEQKVIWHFDIWNQE